MLLRSPTRRELRLQPGGFAACTSLVAGCDLAFGLRNRLNRSRVLARLRCSRNY